MKNYYKTLQVDPNADIDIIKAAYRKLSHKYHPDKSSLSNAQQLMAEINEAYECLSDETKRAIYDQNIREAINAELPPKTEKYNPSEKKGTRPYEYRGNEAQNKQKYSRSNWSNAPQKSNGGHIFQGFGLITLGVISLIGFSFMIFLNKQEDLTSRSIPKIEQKEQVVTSDVMNRYGSENYHKKKYSEALKWFDKAAKAGNSTAQLNLGYMYDTGTGVQKDYSEAIKWYSKAAKAGNSTAQLNLGYMYDTVLISVQN